MAALHVLLRCFLIKNIFLFLFFNFFPSAPLNQKMHPGDTHQLATAIAAVCRESAMTIPGNGEVVVTPSSMRTSLACSVLLGAVSGMQASATKELSNMSSAQAQRILEVRTLAPALVTLEKTHGCYLGENSISQTKTMLFESYNIMWFLSKTLPLLRESVTLLLELNSTSSSAKELLDGWYYPQRREMAINTLAKKCAKSLPSPDKKQAVLDAVFTKGTAEIEKCIRGISKNEALCTVIVSFKWLLEWRCECAPPHKYVLDALTLHAILSSNPLFVNPEDYLVAVHKDFVWKKLPRLFGVVDFSLKVVPNETDHATQEYEWVTLNSVLNIAAILLEGVKNALIQTR